MTSFFESIQSIAGGVVDTMPSTVFGRVIRYSDNTVTVETSDGVLENIKSVNNPHVGGACILVPVEDDFVCVPLVHDEYSKDEIDDIVSEIISGQIDLSKYVKKADIVDPTKYDIDLDLSFGTKGFDDTITIDMDIVDYVVSKVINIGDD